MRLKGGRIGVRPRTLGSLLGMVNSYVAYNGIYWTYHKTAGYPVNVLDASKCTYSFGISKRNVLGVVQIQVFKYVQEVMNVSILAIGNKN